jgi:hypothetical protein
MIEAIYRSALSGYPERPDTLDDSTLLSVRVAQTL